MVLALNKQLFVGTASEARRRLLSSLGLSFVHCVANIDESRFDSEDVYAYVRRIAEKKADAIVINEKNSLLLTCDTVIFQDGDIFGKPSNENEAREFLLKFSNKWHSAISSILLKDLDLNQTTIEVVETRVKFLEISKPILDFYIASNDWQNKAGAYGIQSAGAMLIESVDGCFSNVIGLSIPAFTKLIKPYIQADH